MRFIPDLLVSDYLLYSAIPVFFLILLWVVRDIARRSELYQLHSSVFVGGVLGLGLLWLLTARSGLGLEYHFHGAMLFTLLYGWRHAFIGMLLIQIIVTLLGTDTTLGYFALNNLLFVLLPLWIAQRIQQRVERYLPPNFFVFIFVTAFFGAALSLAAMLMFSSTLLSIVAHISWSRIWKDFLQYLPLMMFGEAFMTGLLMTLLTLFKPQWVKGFDGGRYFK